MIRNQAITLNDIAGHYKKAISALEKPLRSVLQTDRTPVMQEIRQKPVAPPAVAYPPRGILR